jgi:hypothetical protein
MPNRKRSPPATRRRALELLVASADGCTEAIMLAHGFTVAQMVELVRAGLGSARMERVVAPSHGTSHGALPGSFNNGRPIAPLMLTG